jgi:hypothetical protein
MSQGWRPVPAARLAFRRGQLSRGLLRIGWLCLLAGLGSGSSLAAPPSLPDSRLGIRTAPLLLLSRADVRADVGLDQAQIAEAGRALEELYAQAAELKGLSGPEVLARKKSIDEAEQQWLQTKLTEAQRKRLIEIDLQWEGPSALIHRPVLADHLHLTQEQRTSLTAAVADCRRRRQQGGDVHECERRLFEQTRALLTPEQLERWRAMLGRPLNRSGPSTSSVLWPAQFRTWLAAGPSAAAHPSS